MSSPLQDLVKIVSSGIEGIEAAHAKAGISYPSLNDPFTPTPLDDDQEMAATCRLIVAAAAQIIATVRAPVETLKDYAPAMYKSAALGIVVDANVADILKTAGTQGLHVKEIGAQAGIEPTKIARVLRYLATRHVFREITPNVFANNRISTLLIKAKSLEEIKADSEARYDGASTASFIGHVCDEGLASVPYMTSFLRDSEGVEAAPFNLMVKGPITMWDWFERTENTSRGRRFAAAMKGDPSPPSIFTNSIDWKALEKDAVVVDVGGSIGSVTLMLAKAFPHLQYIVQDLDKPIAEARKFWATSYPEAITNGKVKLQPHDFFQPQPIKGAAVYFMRLVTHDWPEADVHKIFKATREAAGPSSRLIVFDMLMLHACMDPESPFPEAQSSVPSPLLPNSGPAMGEFLTMIDMQMLNLFGGQERTLEDFSDLGKAAGWKLEAVKPGMLATFIFTPIGTSL